MSWIDDGDTIEVMDGDVVTKVRLLAINTPDRGECFADQALDHMIDTLKARTVHLEVSDQDQFGRTLAHVFDEGRHINLELVELGLGFVSTPEENDPYGSTLLETEDMAHATGIGLWAPNACGSDGPLPEIAIDPDRSVVDPTGPDDQDLTREILTIVNEGSETIDLAGWIIRDTSTRHRFTFPSGVTLAPGERLVVPSSDPGWDPGDSPVWNNGGDMGLLQLPDGTVVDRWRY